MINDVITILEAKRIECGSSRFTTFTVREISTLIDMLREPEQPDMFAAPNAPEPDLTPRAHDTPTSIKAANKAAPKARGRALDLIRAIDDHGRGLIREQACRISGVLPQTACGILNVLEEQGYLMTNGTRPNIHGNDCQIYHITEKGKAWLMTAQN
jgi:hypothetical protein